VRAQTLSFFIDPALLPEVMRVIDHDVLPEFQSIPDFVGLVVLRSERNPRQVFAMSVWTGEFEGSEVLIQGLRRRLREIAGTSPAADHHAVLRYAVGRTAPEGITDS